MTLAVGIGGACAVYTLAVWVLLRPVPGVGQQNELATVLLESSESRAGGWSMSNTDHRALRSRVTSLAELAATSETDVHLSGLTDQPLRLRAQLVTQNYFDLLQVRAQVGRLFNEAGGADADANAVVLSDRLARHHFGSAAAAPGLQLTINDGLYTVVGVAPRGFRGHELPGSAELWLPASAAPALLHAPTVLSDPASQLWSTTIARLREGLSPDALSAELTATLGLLQDDGVAPFLGAGNLRMTAYPGIGLDPEVRADVGSTLRILSAAAALLLILACANVANLGLIRATASRGEVAMRRALGAGSGRIVRGRLLEGAILGLVGSVLGLAIAVFVLRAFSFGAIEGVADNLEGVRMEPRVVLFAILVALVAGCASAALPAIASRRVRAGAILHASDRSTGQGGRTREGLVVAQVALSAVLAVSAGLLGRTLLNLRAIEMGVETRGVVSFAVDADLQGYSGAQLAALLSRLVTALEREPGVEAAGVIGVPPFASLRMPALLKLPADPETQVRARSLQVSPGTLDALGMRLIAGSPLVGAWLDSTAASTVVLNEQAVRALFPGATPAEVVGRIIEQARGAPRPARVVGVVADARLDGLGSDIEPLYVRPWGHGYDLGRFGVYVRTRDDVEALRARIPFIVRDIDPTLPAYDVLTLEERIARLTLEQRFLATLGAALLTVALFLTVLGVYAALSQTVLERTREFGVRAALGAAPRALLGNVVARGAVLTAVGMVIGLGSAAAATRYLESRLFGVGHLDLAAYIAGALALTVTALPAALLPANRAARTDPALILRAN
jgi:predicted permease